MGQCERKVWTTDKETGYVRVRACFSDIVNGACVNADNHAWDDAWEVNRHR